MKDAWIGYTRKILWRYPKNNYPEENAAIDKAISTGTPELVALAFITKRMTVAEAARYLNLTDQDAEAVLFSFLEKIACNIGLPTGGNRNEHKL